MKKRTITWLWENEVAQELFAKWVQFPEPSQTAQEIDIIRKFLDLKPSNKAGRIESQGKELSAESYFP